MTLVWGTLRPETSAPYLQVFYTPKLWLNDIDRNMVLFFLFCLINFIFVPDYINLLQSRMIIGVISRVKSVLVTLFFLILNLAVSMGIFLIISMISTTLVVAVFGWSSPQWPTLYSLESAWGVVQYLYGDMFGTNSLTLNDPFLFMLVPTGVFLYASLFTTIWVWLYVLAAGAVRLALRLQPVVRATKWFLDIDGKPIRSIGVVVGLLGAILWWGLVLVVGTESPVERPIAMEHRE
jgi:hypothetical protein